MKTLLPLKYLITFLVLLSITATAQASTKFGVIAPRGPLKVHAKWDELGKYLSSATGTDVEIVAMDPSKTSDMVAAREIDFALLNPTLTYAIHHQFGAEPLATAKFKNSGAFLGGVIIASKESGITDIDGLKNKNVLAFKIGNSAAAYAFQTKHLRDKGIDPHKDFASFRGAKRQDEIVLAVSRGLADAGFVKTGLVEAMIKEGKVKMEDLTIIDPQSNDSYPLVCSTRLYPTWTVSKLADTDSAMADSVKAALIALTGDNAASQKAKLDGFIEPPEFEAIGDVMLALKLPPFNK